MRALVFILFWRQPDLNFRLTETKTQFAVVLFGLVVYVVIPISSFFGYGDSYLSSSLYSGNVSQAIMELDNPSFEKLPQTLRSHIALINGVYILNFTTWSYGELNVPLYPEPYIFKVVGNNVCDLVDRQGAILQINERSTLFRKSYINSYTCENL
jgi:hypothetical protein